MYGLSGQKSKPFPGLWKGHCEQQGAVNSCKRRESSIHGQVSRGKNQAGYLRFSPDRLRHRWKRQGKLSRFPSCRNQQGRLCFMVWPSACINCFSFLYSEQRPEPAGSHEHDRPPNPQSGYLHRSPMARPVDQCINSHGHRCNKMHLSEARTQSFDRLEPCCSDSRDDATWGVAG